LIKNKKDTVPKAICHENQSVKAVTVIPEYIADRIPAYIHPHYDPWIFLVKLFIDMGYGDARKSLHYYTQ
jgi:hypothetical protein